MIIGLLSLKDLGNANESCSALVGWSGPVNDTLETTSAPSSTKSNLWPLRSSWICTSDRRIALPNTVEEAGGFLKRSDTLLQCLLALSDTQIYSVFRDTATENLHNRIYPAAENQLLYFSWK